MQKINVFIFLSFLNLLRNTKRIVAINIGLKVSEVKLTRKFSFVSSTRVVMNPKKNKN